MRDARRRILDSIEAEDLPTLPEIIARLDAVLADVRAGAPEMAQVIETDPVLTVRILRVANSAYYAPRDGRVIGTVGEAITRIGPVQTRNLCLAVVTMGLFFRRSDYVDAANFWQHSLAVARLARDLAAKARRIRADKDEVFVCGLLHELGTLVLDQFFPREYAAVRQRLEWTGKPIDQIEYEELGIDHGELAGRLLGKWRLPEHLVETAWHHHQPHRTSEEHRDICNVVHIADHYVSNQLDCPGPGEENSTYILSSEWGALGIPSDQVKDVLRDMQKVERWAGGFAPILVGQSLAYA